MEDGESRFNARELRAALAGVAGSLALVAGAALSGLLAAMCFVVGAPLVGYAACTAFRPDKGDACTPQPCWQEHAVNDPPDAPQPAIGLHESKPTTVRRWLERVEHEGRAARRDR